ncbi:MAG: histidine phosphatase family protein [Propionibacteriaceae bacterium]|nr:histidine phosphatase family protein [Propionibacteriaceae bacterium]
MRLLLIRHGESTNNHLLATTGVEDNRVSDPELTDTGLAQAERLGQAFADGLLPRPDLLISSLMIRAVQTVAPISAALDMPVRGDATVYEVKGVHSGNPQSAEGAHPQPGAPASRLLATCPRLQLPADADEAGWYHSPFETPAQAWQRAQAVINGLAASYGHTDHIVAMVTHGWFSQFLIRAFIEWPPPDETGRLSWWFDTWNTATTMLEHPGDVLAPRGCIRWINRVDHLPVAMRTN